MKKTIGIILFAVIAANAQNLKTKPNWHNLDYAKDGIRGMSTEKAYAELLKDKPSKTVIVGVIDSGIDINHEDLKNIIWVNTREIPGNGKDDDENGFIDDVNGWDFIGGADGTDVNQEQLEMTRIYKNLKQKFGDNPKKRLIKKNKSDYNLYKKLEIDIKDKREEAEKYLPMYTNMYKKFTEAEETLKAVLKKDVVLTSDVEQIKDENFDRSVRQAKQFWLQLTAMGATLSDLKDGVQHFEDEVKFNYNLDFEPRKVVGDDLSKLQYGKYGNNEVTGPDAMHGTHVAGIIAAQRENGLGVKGVADNVKIMVIRCVPNGDERDKDVANAIRYAVDNGAQVINMSFGKAYSPDKKWVDEAVKYAESKDVVLVAASGNDNLDIDQEVHYPVREYLNGGQAQNWISVGALNHEEAPDLAATFSNYGKKGVDVFAPGVAIYSTVPGNKYEEKQGTSMASPAVAGVAALLRSYFPSLTAPQIKNIILDSSVKLPDATVKIPGGEEKVKFGDLSVTGGVVNTYNAVKMATQMTQKQQ